MIDRLYLIRSVTTILKNIINIHFACGSTLNLPWNLPLDLIENLLSLTLTISGLLIGTASFILGLYLPQFQKMAPKEKLMPYLYLEASLLAPAVLTIALTCISVVFSSQELWLKTYFLLILAAPVVPAIAVMYILLKNIPTGRQ